VCGCAIFKSANLGFFRLVLEKYTRLTILSPNLGGVRLTCDFASKKYSPFSIVVNSRPQATFKSNPITGLQDEL